MEAMRLEQQIVYHEIDRTLDSVRPPFPERRPTLVQRQATGARLNACDYVGCAGDEVSDDEWQDGLLRRLLRHLLVSVKHLLPAV